jgi:hypothetical protein
MSIFHKIGRGVKKVVRGAGNLVSDVVGGVTKTVGKVVDALGGVVKDVGKAVVNTVDYVIKNPEVAVIAIAAPQLLPTIGVTGIAVQPVTAGLISASQGGSIEDIGKAAVGSLVGQGVGVPVAQKVGTAIGAAGNTAQTALANAVGGAVGSAAGAAATGGDVGEAALLGGLGSGSASLARSGATSLANVAPRSATAEIAADIGEAFGRTAISGDLSGELTGAAFNTLAREGDIAMTELRQPTNARDQVVGAFSQPRSPGVGTQIGEPTAELTGGIQYGSRQGAAGTDIVRDVDLPSVSGRFGVADNNTLPEVIVKPEMRFDVRTGKLIPVIKPSQPATQAPTQPARPPARAPEEMTGKELIERTETPAETSAEAPAETTRLPGVDVIDEMQVEEQPLALDKVSDEELLAAIEESFKPMDVRIARVAGRRGTAPMSVSPRAVGTSPTAAIVGQKEPIFGGEEDAQQDVWNTRSLRLRKALG